MEIHAELNALGDAIKEIDPTYTSESEGDSPPRRPNPDLRRHTRRGRASQGLRAGIDSSSEGSSQESSQGSSDSSSSRSASKKKGEPTERRR